VSTASVPPPGWVEPQRPATPASPSPFSSPERPAGSDFASRIAVEDKRRLDTKRLFARLIDNVLCVPIYFIALYAWETAALLAWVIMSLVHVVVAHFCEVTIGATPGKLVFRLRVADRDTGALPTPRQAAIRGVTGIVENSLIGLLALHFSKGRTRLGDRAAGTVVVDTVRHPAQAQAITSGAFVYGLVWLLPIALVGVGVLRGRAGVHYRQQADALCRQADATINARIDNEGMQAVVAAYQQLDAGLQRLHPPGAWAERHERLAGQVHADAMLLPTELRAVNMDQRDVAQRAQEDYLRLKARAHADGYVDCGR
jgi:uncharacterized RDD family membrane protein YckC